jgi:hypothetical protein
LAETLNGDTLGFSKAQDTGLPEKTKHYLSIKQWAPLNGIKVDGITVDGIIQFMGSNCTRFT